MVITQHHFLPCRDIPFILHAIQVQFKTLTALPSVIMKYSLAPLASSVSTHTWYFCPSIRFGGVPSSGNICLYPGGTLPYTIGDNSSILLTLNTSSSDTINHHQFAASPGISRSCGPYTLRESSLPLPDRLNEGGLSVLIARTVSRSQEVNSINKVKRKKVAVIFSYLVRKL